MNVLFYSENFYPSIGGVEKSSQLIAQYLYDKGVNVIVVTHTPFDGKEVMPFKIIRNPNKHTITHLIKKSDLIYMNGFNYGIFLISKLRRKKIVMTYRDLTMICPNGTKWKGDGPCLQKASMKVCIPCLREGGEIKIIRRLFRPVIKSIISFFVDVNVCTSLFGIKRYVLCNKHLILNGIDTSVFLPPSSRRINSIPEILFVGRLIPEKGCQVLIKSLSIIKKSGFSFHLCICGDGPYRPRLEELVKQHNLDFEVNFYGSLQGQALISIIQKADVAIVPSLIDEPFGLTAIEAMSCGLPVIASNVGGLGGIVAEAGFTFERGDVNGLAGHLQRLLADAGIREEAGRNARRLAVEKYDWNRMAEEYYHLFLKLQKTNN